MKIWSNEKKEIRAFLDVVFSKAFEVNLYHSLGKFSRWKIDDIFLIFSQWTGFGISEKIVWIRDSLHEMSNIVSWEKKRKVFQNVFWKFYPEC